MSYSATHLIWLDLEMTGLDTAKDHIIEIATVVTDSQLNIISCGPEIAVFQPDDILNQMDNWNTRQHTRSGLVDRVRQSTMTLEMAEKQTIEFLMQYVPANQSPMCGNSICQDRRFLYRQMPQLEKYFHYRNLDVTTIKELARHWAPNVYKGFKKEAKHRALEDIKESIEELRYYRTHLFCLENC